MSHPIIRSYVKVNQPLLSVVPIEVELVESYLLCLENIERRQAIITDGTSQFQKPLINFDGF